MSTRMIDAFPHIFPPAFWERLTTVNARYVGRANVQARPALWDLDARFRIMDAHPGYVQVLTLSSPAIEEFADRRGGMDLARLANDGMADLVRRYPDRFLGFAAALYLEDVDASLREAERAMAELGALGVQIYTTVNGRPMDDPRFEPLYALLERSGKTLWVHPTRPQSVPDYAGEADSKYGLFIKLGWPYETALFMSRFIYSGIMERYPSLRVLTHHAGGFIPHVAGRLHLQHETPETRREIGVDPKWDRDAVHAAYKRFYGDTVFSGMHHPLDCALAYFGTDHILFGTDMPWGAEGGAMFVRETIEAVREAAPDDATRAALFEANARRVLGLR